MRGHHRLPRLAVDWNSDYAIIPLVPALLSLLAFQHADNLSENNASHGGGFFSDQQHVQGIAVTVHCGKRVDARPRMAVIVLLALLAARHTVLPDDATTRRFGSIHVLRQG